MFRPFTLGKIGIQLKRKKTSLNMEPQILLEVEPDLQPAFFSLLGFGFYVDVQTGCSLKEFLSDNMGLDAAYIDNRIQTIFLDGKAVDTIDDCVIQDGSTIALSAAMPGLVGATLRRKSHYAAMRGPISHTDEPAVHSGAKGSVTVKLFNLIAKELGNDLLERGVRIDTGVFKQFIRTFNKNHSGKIKAAHINDKRIDPVLLAKTDLKDEKVFLQVRSD